MGWGLGKKGMKERGDGRKEGKKERRKEARQSVFFT
jgi:hypothetical protein